MFGIGLTTQRIKLSSLKIISHLCTCTNELERSHQRTSQDRTATFVADFLTCTWNPKMHDSYQQRV
jgi:hypothetical protein